MFLSSVLTCVENAVLMRVLKILWPLLDLLWHVVVGIVGRHWGRVSLLTVPLTDYCNGIIVNCLFLKTTIRTALS